MACELTAASGVAAAVDGIETSRDIPRQTEAPKLTVRGLRKTYGSVVALAGADLDLRRGEFVTLLGPSGSGKTTLLMAIAGLSEPDGGSVWIDGRLATYLPPYRRDLGMVFQNYALFPHMTIAENIAFPLHMRRWGRKEVRAAVSRALALVHLPAVADRLPSQLSGGQQQRVAVARALVYEPSIVLMDEPLGALDKKLRDDMQIEIKHLHRQLGATFLYVTHDQEEALTMSDRICLMNNAAIEQLGTPEDLYFRPVSLFAATFVGDSNVIDAKVGPASGRELQVCPGCSITAPSDLPEGSPVKVVVRPEWIAADRPEDGQNSAAGVVTEVILSGAMTKIFARLENDFILRVSDLTGPSTRRLAPGDEVTFRWSKESTLIFDAVTGLRA